MHVAGMKVASLGTNISPQKSHFEDDFYPFLQVGWMCWFSGGSCFLFRVQMVWEVVKDMDSFWSQWCGLMWGVLTDKKEWSEAGQWERSTTWQWFLSMHPKVCGFGLFWAVQVSLSLLVWQCPTSFKEQEFHWSFFSFSDSRSWNTWIDFPDEEPIEVLCVFLHALFCIQYALHCTNWGDEKFRKAGLLSKRSKVAKKSAVQHVSFQRVSPKIE